MKAGVPWFIIGFFIMAILHSVGVIPPVVSHAAKLVSQQFEIIALAAIGMRVKFGILPPKAPVPCSTAWAWAPARLCSRWR